MIPSTVRFQRTFPPMYIKIIVAVLFLSSSSLLRADLIAVHGARLWAEPDQTRFVVDTAAEVSHRVFPLADPDRLVIDIVDAKLDGELPAPKANDPILAGVRSGIRQGDDLRIVLDLKQPGRAKSFILPPNRRYGHRLVVDVSPLAERRAPHRSAKIAPGDRRDILVAVDAGHGGDDPGAIGVHGTKEKDVTLAIARKLAALIDKEEGMRALLIRDGDYYIRLRKRTEIARRENADLFVSIHADAFRDHGVRGSSVYVLSAGGASSEAAKWLAAKENSADQIGGIPLTDGDEVLASVLLDMTRGATLEQSTIAAQRVLDHLGTLGKVHRRDVQKAGFVVLKALDTPSMLVETAFISNPDEERRLRSRRHQQTVAEAILQGIKDYFRRYPPPGTRWAQSDAPRRHRIVSGDTLSEIAAQYSVSLDSLRRINRLDTDLIRIGQVLTIP